jgi:ethanolamine permease
MSLTAAMITMSVFGAIVMYIMSMLSLFRLRKTEPNLERTFKAPGYPLVPGIALGLALVCLAAMIWFNGTIALLFLGLMSIGMVYFLLTGAQRDAVPADALLQP